MIYLIGVDHIKSQWEYQNGSNKKFVSSFTNILRRHVKRLNVTVVAEEFNQECLDQQDVKISTAQRVAEEFCIKHIFCEPPAKERIKLGILSKEEISQQLFHKELWQIPDDTLEQQLINGNHQKYFAKREQYWLDKIKDLKEKRILFICGRSHIESFKKLLEEHEFKVSILSS